MPAALIGAVVLTAAAVWAIPALNAHDAEAAQTYTVQCPPGTAVTNVSQTPGESTCLDAQGRVIANR